MYDLENTNVIPPVDTGIKRPLWSVMIPTYNPKNFIFEALESVLSQDPGEENMQIEIVDDCSDKVDIPKLIGDLGKGRIKYYRLPKNVGHSFNFTEALRRSKGKYIHLLHDDDYVKPGFYKKFGEIFEKFPEAGAVYCRQEYIDDTGKFLFNSEPDLNETGYLEDALIKIAERQRIQYCAMAVKRSTYEKTGGFIRKNIGCEDWEMWVRIAAKFKIVYEPEIYATYRIHRTSMTLNDMRTGQDMRFLTEAVDIFNQYLPKEKRKEVKKFTKKYYAGYSFRNSMMLLDEQSDEKGAAEQLTETIRLNSGFVYENLNALNKFSIQIKGTGVSVLLFTDNNEDTVKATLRSIVNQRVPAYMPFEIIISDNNSSDNTLQTAEEYLKLYSGKINFRILTNEDTNIYERISKAAAASNYNFLLFCYSGNILGENYIHNVSENMMKETDLGILSGYSELETNIRPPEWFTKWKNQSYHLGDQYEYNSDITWSIGSVWKEGMAIRKEALDSLWKNKFIPIFSGLSKSLQNYSYEKEISYALRLNEWRVRYSVELRLTKFLKEEDFHWRKLRSKKMQDGIDSVLLKPIKNSVKKVVEDFSEIPVKINSRKILKHSFRKLRSISYKKLVNYAHAGFNDEDFLKIEFHFGRIKAVMKDFKGYNKRLYELKRVFRKKDFRYLKFIMGESYYKYPLFKNPNYKKGVSVIINYDNSENGYLYKCFEKVSHQILPKGFNWEIIIAGKKTDANSENKIRNIRKKSSCNAELIFVNDRNTRPFSSKKAGLSRSKYEYLVFLNENNFINPDYVRIAYRAMNHRRQIGLLGGYCKLESGVKLPKWFHKHKQIFGIDVKYPTGHNLTYTDHTLWDDGLIIRRAAIQKILGTDFYLDSDMEADLTHINYEGKVLTSQMKKTGWEVWFEPRLRMKKFIPVNQLKWKNIRQIHRILGAEITRKELIRLSENPNKINGNAEALNWIHKTNKILGELRKYPLRKIFSSKSDYRGDAEVIDIEELQGRAKEIFRNRKKYNELLYANSDKPIKENKIYIDKSGNLITNLGNSGVSVIICCYNSSALIERTLKYLINQKVPDIIPWEVILVDNASTDNTSEIAEKYWMHHNCLARLKIVKEPKPGLSAAREKGIETAKYEYMILCDDDNLLDENFVARVFDIMSSDKMIGVLGGRGIGEFESIPQQWFYDWQNSFAIGKQADKRGDITWTRGYVWGAAMTVRKSAWDKLRKSGFKSMLTDRKGKTLSAGGDTEICYALRNDVWKIWYDPELIFTHYITKERLNWRYVRRLFRGFGQASAGLDFYRRKGTKQFKGTDLTGLSGSVNKELRETIRILRKSGIKKIKSFSRRREGDTDIPMIEYCLGRIESLIKTRKTYNRGLHLLKRNVKKSELRILSSALKGIGKKFPKYNIEKKYNGVSVIVCTYNGEDRLPDTFRHIAKQKVARNILWEVILVDNASTDNSKKAVISEWKKHNCRAKLTIADEYTQGLSAARQKGFEVSRYEYLVLCDDDNWLDENFVQTTFEIMSGNEKIGVLGGPNKALCEAQPPEWFKYFQKGFATGEQADIHTEKITEGDITWKRGFVWGAGMIIRKSAMNELYANGFYSIMSDRKGYHLSSGGDSELCFALVLSGWKVWYDKRLKLIHCMPSGRLVWNYLIRLFSGFGITSVGLDHYEKAVKLGRSDFTEEEILKQDWKYEFRKTLSELKKIGVRNLLSLRHPQDDNTKVPMMEYHLARLAELWRVRKDYDKQSEQIRNAIWKKSNKELKAGFRKFIETENDYRYGWPWQILGDNPEIKSEDYPKISILSPSFNSENTIEKAILSVLNQGYPNFEHIICDGGSTDDTVNIIKKYPHVKWISEPDRGQCDAMNKAFNMSNGDIISYLNVDDYYQRGAFFKIADAFGKNPDAGMIVGNLYFEFEDHTFIRKPETDYRKIMLPFKYIFPINPVSYFYKRIVQIDAGPFPLDNHYTMDYWFLLKAYQNFKIKKIEDYLGTFWMNGLNKTSGADNRKNTHYRVVEHCWNYDKKNLPYYLYNYYKHYYYDIKPYNLSRIAYKIKKNLKRVVSVLTFRKNKYYNEKLYQKARSEYYLSKRFKAFNILLLSYLIYPKALKMKSRSILLAYSFLGEKRTESIKWYYFFFTTPPGVPLGNKLHYYAELFGGEKKFHKSVPLYFLTYLVSPKFIFKGKGYEISNSGSKLRYLNPLNWLKGFINFFRYRKYRDISYNFYLKAGEKYLSHKNIYAVFYMTLGFFVYPFSFSKRSRLNLLAYSMFGNTLAEKFRNIYHIYKDDPEYPFAQKLNYFGNELRKENKSLEGNLVLMLAYICNPKYIFRREKIKKSKIIYASDFKLPKRKTPFNPVVHIKNTGQYIRKAKYSGLDLKTRIKNFGELSRYRVVLFYDYFRYRKFKARSKELYALAQKSYTEQKRFDTIKYIIPSFILYPVSLTKRNKWGLLINSIKGNSVKVKEKKK